MVILELTVPGNPLPKERPKVGRGRGYTPSRTAEAEEYGRTLVDLAMRGRKAHAGPVSVYLRFYRKDRRRVDLDNLEKIAMDFLQRGRRGYGGAILDDSQVEELWARVYRGIPGEEPRTEILVLTLDE